MSVVRLGLDSNHEMRAEELQIGRVLCHREVPYADCIHMRSLMHHNSECIELVRDSHCQSERMRDLDIVEDMLHWVDVGLDSLCHMAVRVDSQTSSSKLVITFIIVQRARCQ